MSQLQFRSDDTSLWEEKFGNGSGSDLTLSSPIVDAPTKTSCSVTVSSINLTASSATGFSTGDLVVIYQSRNGSTPAGSWMLNKINNVSGNNFTLKYPSVATFDTTAQIQKLVQYSNVTINAALTGSVWDGVTGGNLFILCSGTTTVNAAISLIGKGYRGGAINSSYPSTGFRGEGTAGDNAGRQTSANGSGGGGGEGIGGSANGGGGGGNSVAGDNGSSGEEQVGIGGIAVGNASLTVAPLGGSGGAGGAGGSGNNGGSGGNSGGFLLIITKDFVMGAGGSINLSGTNGSSASGGVGDGGGGGGSGGSGLIKTQIATLGTSLIVANGGTGGTRNGPGAPGGSGAFGRLHLDYLTSFTGTTSPSLDATQDNTLTSSGGSGGSAALFLLL